MTVLKKYKKWGQETIFVLLIKVHLKILKINDMDGLIWNVICIGRA